MGLCKGKLEGVLSVESKGQEWDAVCEDNFTHFGEWDKNVIWILHSDRGFVSELHYLRGTGNEGQSNRG